MSAERKGKYLRLSPLRKLVGEFVRHAQHVPLIPVSKQMSLGKVARLREQVNPRPSWPAVFLRAYGLLSRDHAPLRQLYIPWPYAHLYEHPNSDCAVLVERELDGEPALIGAKIRTPEDLTL